jgi:D-arginine utilization repressor
VLGQIDSYVPVCDAIARLHAPHVEVVLHDLKSDTIHYIANCFSKRRAGDSSLSDVADIDYAASVIGPYAKTNWDGRRLRSISSVIRDAGGNPIGLLCINQDVEAVSGLLEQLTDLLGPPVPMAPATALFAGDWRERINEHVGAFLASRNATLAGLSRSDVDDLVAHLDRASLFEIRNAPPYVAEVLGLSRATLYNRLKKVRGRDRKERLT